MIRLVYALRRSKDLSMDEFQDYMSTRHGPLVAGYATSLRIGRYRQSYTIDDPFNEFIQTIRGTMPPYDGVDEIWWDDREELAAALATPEGKQAAQDIVEDEKKFVDFSGSSLWFAIELPQINPLPENIVARKESPLMKLFGPLSPLPTLSMEEAQRYWLVQHGPFVRSYAEAMRFRRYMQVHMIQDSIADKLRAARGIPEAPYMGHAEIWLDRGVLTWSPQNTPEAKEFNEKLVIEDEKRFMDFPRCTMMATKERIFIDN